MTMQIQQQGTGIGDTNTIPNVRPMPNALARPLGKGRKKVKASLTTENEGIITLKDEERKKQEKSSKHVEKQGKKRESKTCHGKKTNLYELSKQDDVQPLTKQDDVQPLTRADSSEPSEEVDRDTEQVDKQREILF